MRLNDFILDKLEMLTHIKITIRKEGTIRGVIVLFMECNKVLVLQVSNELWITTGVPLVLGVLEEILVDLVQEGIVGIRHCTLHFIVDDTFVHEARFGVACVLKLNAVAFLAEIEVVEIWEEGAVGVNRQQVAEILRVLRRERVHREIAASPCVHVGVQTTFEHVEEGITHWVVLAAAESQVLQDMGLTSVIIWRRSEQNCKHVVHVRTVQMHPFGSSCRMLKLVRVDVKELNSLNLSNLKSVNLVTNLKIVRDTVLTTGNINPYLMALGSCLCLCNCSRFT